MTPEDSEKLEDSQILENVPKDSLVSKSLENGEQVLVTSPFTYRWVMKRLKKNPATTAYELLIEAGFTEEGRGV